MCVCVCVCVCGGVVSRNWDLKLWNLMSSPGYVRVCMHGCFSGVWLFTAPWTVAHQAPLSLGLSWQEYWSGVPCSPPRGSSQPRDHTDLSCIVRWILYHWATWEAFLFGCCCCITSVMSDSSRAHGLQPNRLLHPWDFPGQSTGVGCHHLLRFIWLSYTR